MTNLHKTKDTEEDYSMFTICEECRHSMSMHVGVVDMGGGHSEPLGCTHNVDGGLCDCLKYEEGWDE